MFRAELQFIESEQDDFSAIAAIFHPDIVVHEPGSLPYAGDWCGYESLGRLFKSMREAWSFIDVENMRATIDGDTLFMCCTLVATARSSGKEIRQPFAEVLKIEEGLVVEGTPYYYDTAAISAVLEDKSIDAKERVSMRHVPSVEDLDGATEPIRFAIGECSLGSILVATTRKGICAILLGDEADALLRDLHDRFPEARLICSDLEFERLMAEVVAFEDPSIGLDLPLDVEGTAFQQRVWQALREVPAGSTAAYAVGEACAANMIAVAIPCHRVVRKDGTLADYRWGFRRKRRLLKREAAA